MYLEHYGRYLGLLAASGNPAAMQIAEPLLPFAERSVHCIVGMLDTILPNWSDTGTALAVEWMEKAERLLPQTWLTKKEPGVFFYLRGLMELKRGNRSAAEAAFLESVAAFDHPNNEVRKELAKLGTALVRER